MTDKHPNEEGERFTRLVKKAGISFSKLGRDVGASAQAVNNWKQRGVSAQFAGVVAQKLGCRPDEISVAKGGEGAPLPSQVEGISDLQRALLASTEGLDYGQIAEVIAHAVRLRAAKPSEPPTPQTYHRSLHAVVNHDDYADMAERAMGLKRDPGGRRLEDRPPPGGIDRRGTEPGK